MYIHIYREDDTMGHRKDGYMQGERECVCEQRNKKKTKIEKQKADRQRTQKSDSSNGTVHTFIQAKRNTVYIWFDTKRANGCDIIIIVARQSQCQKFNAFMCIHTDTVAQIEIQIDLCCININTVYIYLYSTYKCTIEMGEKENSLAVCLQCIQRKCNSQ